MTSKKKLLVLTGAGASVDFGMPNVNDVSKILSDATRDRFPLLFDQSRGLFEYFEDQLAEHWRLRGRLSSIERPTFEDVLLAIFETAGALDDKGFASPSTAFLSVRPFPDLGFDRSSRVAADDNVIRQFGAMAVDSLLDEFRRRCLNAERDRPAEFAALRGLVSALAEEFELSFATLNYDDVLYRCANQLETGFDRNGRFDNLGLFHRENWGVFLHLRGSVHFDFRDDNSRFGGFGGLEDVHWVEDLEVTSGQNAFGSGPSAGKALAKFPRSVLVAGFGKETQIQKQPFRTYFAEFDRLVVPSRLPMSTATNFFCVRVVLRPRQRSPATIRMSVVVTMAPSCSEASWHAAVFRRPRRRCSSKRSPRLHRSRPTNGAIWRGPRATARTLKSAPDFLLFPRCSALTQQRRLPIG
jgi:hypothetical protein